MSVLQCTGSARGTSSFQLSFMFESDTHRRSSGGELCLFYCIFGVSEEEQNEIEEAPDDDVANALVLYAVDRRGLSELLADDGSTLIRQSLKSTFVTSRPERFGRSVLRSTTRNNNSLAAGALQQQVSSCSFSFAGAAVVNNFTRGKGTSIVLATVCDTLSGAQVPLSSSNSFVMCCILLSDHGNRSSSADESQLSPAATLLSATGTRPAMQPLKVSSSLWSPLVKPHRFSNILVTSAHVIELAAKFQKYVVGAAATKVCALRASRLVVPISVPDGFCSAQSTSFMTFLTDSQSVTAIHVEGCNRRGTYQQELSYEPLPPISILEVLLRNCRGEMVRSIRPRLGLSLHQALEMGASHATFAVEWYDYLLLAAVPAPLWKTLNHLVDRYYDFVGSNPEPIYSGTPVPATHLSFGMALQHIFHVAEGLRPSSMSVTEFRSKLVSFFGMDPADALHGALSSRSFREHPAHTGTSGLCSSRLSIALGSPHQQAIPSWKRLLCYDSGRHRDLRNILGDIKVTPARVLWCLFPRSMQLLAISQVDRSDRPLLVPKRRSMQLVRISTLANHQEAAARHRLVYTYYFKLSRFARLRRDIQRRRNLLAQSLLRRIESRSALPWFSRWRSFVVNKTRRRKSSIMYVSMLQKDEFLFVKIMFRQWREFALIQRKLKVNTHRELLLEAIAERAMMQQSWSRWLKFVEIRQERRSMFLSASFGGRQSPSSTSLAASGIYNNMRSTSFSHNHDGGAAGEAAALDGHEADAPRSSHAVSLSSTRDSSSRRGSLR